MHIAAVAWLNLANGLSFCSSFCSACMSPIGLRVSFAPLTSASSSRDRESANRISGPDDDRDQGEHRPAAIHDDHDLAAVPAPRGA